MNDREDFDADLSLLVAIAGDLENDYLLQMDEWAESPFGWIKQQQSRTRGKIGEQLVSGWCAAKGFDVTSSPNSDSDRVIGGLRTEIKFSTLWKNGRFKFQQLRDQDYEIVICLGISPLKAHCWVFPKDDLLGNPVGVRPQHGGRAGSDTRWLDVDPNEVPQWLQARGGRLSEAYESLWSLFDAAQSGS